MTTKRSIRLTIFSLIATVLAGLIVTIVLLSTNVLGMQPLYASAYTAQGIEGKAWAAYKTADGEGTAMTTADGAEFINFKATDESNTQYLSPNKQIVLTQNSLYVVFSYSFYNNGSQTFYASVTYEDVDNDDVNINVEYLPSFENAEAFENWGAGTGTNSVAVMPGKEVTCSIKVSVADENLDAIYSGNFDWNLSL